MLALVHYVGVPLNFCLRIYIAVRPSPVRGSDFVRSSRNLFIPARHSAIRRRQVHGGSQQSRQPVHSLVQLQHQQIPCGLRRVSPVYCTRHEACKFSSFNSSEDPGAEDVGHKRSLTGFLRWLRSQGKDVPRLMRRIEDVIIKAIMAATPPVAAACKMFVPHRNNCFGNENTCLFSI